MVGAFGNGAGLTNRICCVGRSEMLPFGAGGFVLLMGLLFCVVPAHGRSGARLRRERAREQAAKTAEAQKQANPEQPATVLVPGPPVAFPPIAAKPLATIAPACDESCQEGRQGVANQGRLVWLSGGLVLVGLFGLGSMSWQGALLRRTRVDVQRQAGWMEMQAGILKDQGEILKGSVAAAQASADVAVRQIRHAVASERPWIDVQMPQKELNYNTLRFVAKNRGSSPARVMMYTVEKVVISTEDTRGGPSYGKNGRFDEAQWRLSGDDFIVGEFQVPPDLSAQVQKGVSVLYQGFVRYHDTLTEDVHETRFCYQAFVQEEGGVRFKMFDAQGFNTMT